MKLCQFFIQANNAVFFALTAFFFLQTITAIFTFAISCICYRIFGIFFVYLIDFSISGLKQSISDAYCFYVKYCDIFITDPELYIVHKIISCHVTWRRLILQKPHKADIGFAELFYFSQ